MAKRNNRRKTLEIMSSIPSRMEQIKHETKKHGGAIPQIIDPEIPYSEPIAKPEIDYSEKNYKLVKRYTPGPLDTIFDLFGVIGTENPVGAFIPAAGAQLTLKQYNVPAGQRLILNQYCFFILVDESPAINYPVCAAPLELMTTTCQLRADFLIYSNGKVPGYLAHSVNTTGLNAEIEGIACLTENPNEASYPIHGGMNLSFNSGSKLEIVFRNYLYAYGGAGRYWSGVGYRIRGFLSPVNPEEK